MKNLTNSQKIKILILIIFSFSGGYKIGSYMTELYFENNANMVQKDTNTIKIKSLTEMEFASTHEVKHNFDLQVKSKIKIKKQQQL